MDVKTAFLNRDVEENDYMDQSTELPNKENLNAITNTHTQKKKKKESSKYS